MKRKLGITTLAILNLIAERGKLLIDELLVNPRKTLGQSLRTINSAKDIEAHYKILEDLTESNIRMIISRLKSRGLVAKSGDLYIPTQAGSKLIDRNRSEAEVVWDGKWRIVFFDIPETKRQQRKWLAYSLRGAGFKALQKSVFVGKNPIDQGLATDLIERSLYQFVRIMTVGEIDDDKILDI